MGNLSTHHGFLPSAVENRATQPRVDLTVDRSTQRHHTHNSDTIAKNEQNHSCFRVNRKTTTWPTQALSTATMFNFQPVPLTKRGSARSRSRQNRNAAIRANVGPATHPGFPHGSSYAALPTTNAPQGKTKLARQQAELSNLPLVMLHAPTYPDRFTREQALASPDHPIYLATAPDPPTDLQSPLCLRPPPTAQNRALQSHSIDTLLLTGRYSSADPAETSFQMWYGILPSPTAVDPDREAADTAYTILVSQIATNPALGHPEGLCPASVTVDPSPPMPIGHEQWPTPPTLPAELTRTRTCFTITVPHDTPAAYALYAMATNQIQHAPIQHTPTGIPRVDAILQAQPLLITRHPGNPVAATGLRTAVSSPLFATRTPAQAWQLLRDALMMELRAVLARRSDEDNLRRASNPDQLPPGLQALLEFADALQPLSEGTKVKENPNKILFHSPQLFHNRITCQTSPYQYILPLPPGFQSPTNNLQITIHPPPSLHPASADLWADCIPTTVLLQSEHRLSSPPHRQLHPNCPTRHMAPLPPPQSITTTAIPRIPCQP